MRRVLCCCCVSQQQATTQHTHARPSVYCAHATSQRLWLPPPQSSDSSLKTPFSSIMRFATCSQAPGISTQPHSHTATPTAAYHCRTFASLATGSRAAYAASNSRRIRASGTPRK